MMTYEEVKKSWESCKSLGRRNGKTFWWMIALAIEKQIPKKPTHTYKRLGFPVEGCCPVCGRAVVFGDGCPNNDCRQAIDWSEE